MDEQRLLKQYFGHKTFRPGQKEIVDHLRAGQDVVGILPTGAGKSVCYQVPALMMEGVTLVISPLISLMRDQVLSLKSAGIPAAYINSSLSPAQLNTVYQRALSGAYRMIYISPERLETDAFLSLTQRLPIAMVAVDEAHCISQWGQDFRPSYLNIANFVDSLPQRPVVGAFTATATDQVRQDIISLLRLQQPFVKVTGFDRSNLFFEVRQHRAVEKPAVLQALLRDRQGKSGIVYCSTRAAVDRVYEDLTLRGFPAVRYHAGLNEAERAKMQEDFQYDRARVMVATNAFGMGIDKSNVRFVIHYNMPLSLEAYYQEAGRAGRDGSRADCILLFSPGDVKTATFLIENSTENEELTPKEQQRHRNLLFRRLQFMEHYCKTSGCYRSNLLSYFGESHADNCGNCANCLRRFRQKDITLEAQMVLSCVHRMQRLLGHPSDAELLCAVLYGSPSLAKDPLHTLSTYGIMSGYSMAAIAETVQQLVEENCLSEDGRHRLSPEPKSDGILFDGVRLMASTSGPTTPAGRPRAAALTAEQQARLDRLLKLREKFSRREGVPPYAILSDAVLTEIAVELPQSFSDLTDLSGVSSEKARRYGRDILRLLHSSAP